MQSKGLGFTLLLCAFVLSACVGSAPLTAKNRASIQSISVSDQVKMPDVMFYRGPEYALGALKVPVEYVEKSIGEVIQHLMREHKIDVAQMVRDQFIKELEKHRLFNPIVTEGGDAELKLTIRIYGFAYEMSSQLKPMLGVEGSLIKSNDTILWKKYGYVTNLSKETPPNTLGRFIDNPKLMREAFAVAAQIVVEDLITHMRMK